VKDGIGCANSHSQLVLQGRPDERTLHAAARLVRYLTRSQQEILREFQKFAEMEAVAA
jgi:hypothetical protein